MNKKELVAKIAQDCGLKKNEASLIFDTTLAIIKDTFLNGDKVMISEFGTFNIKNRNSKTCYNPKTKKRTQVLPSTAIVFKPAKAMKALLNETCSASDSENTI